MSEIVFNPPKSGSLPDTLQSQVENLQTTLASLNQQVIVLQEALQERDQKIAELQTKLSENTPQVGSLVPSGVEGDSWGVKKDQTLTIVGALINLYNFIFPSQSNVTGKLDFLPGKDSTG